MPIYAEGCRSTIAVDPHLAKYERDVGHPYFVAVKQRRNPDSGVFMTSLNFPKAGRLLGMAHGSSVENNGCPGSQKRDPGHPPKP